MNKHEDGRDRIIRSLPERIRSALAAHDVHFDAQLAEIDVRKIELLPEDRERLRAVCAGLARTTPPDSLPPSGVLLEEIEADDLENDR